MVRLTGTILDTKLLTGEQKEQMFKLFCRYFTNVTRQKFNEDLLDKKWVILLRDYHSAQIQGFSTQTLMEISLDGVSIKAIFSGDTVIDKHCWGGTTLVREWLKLVFSLKKTFSKSTKFYWFLIAMGYRTYRFLPVYLKKFYPCYYEDTPVFEKRIIDVLALERYPLEYNRKSGVISHNGPKECLKKGISDVDEPLLKDPHIKFFVEKNPDYISGNELVCIAEIKEDNLKPIAFRAWGVSK